MILQGTIVNTLAVLLGASLGALLAKRLPERISATLFVGIGLFTFFLGIKLSLETENPLIALLSLLLGGALGSALALDERLRGFIGKLSWTSAGNASETLEAVFEDNSREADAKVKENQAARSSDYQADRPDSQSRHPMHGVLNAFLLFCVGSMTVLGCLQEGMGRGSELLLAKAVLDGISSLALASAFGGIIALVAIPLFLFQSSLTLAAVYIAPYLDESSLANLNGVGGLLLLGLSLEILELKSIRVLNLLPALILAPVLTILQTFALGFL